MWSADIVVIVLGIGGILLVLFVASMWNKGRQRAPQESRRSVQEEEIRLLVQGEDHEDSNGVRDHILEFVESCPQVLLDPPPSVNVVQRQRGDLRAEVTFWRTLGVGSITDLYTRLTRALQPHHLRWQRLSDKQRERGSE